MNNLANASSDRLVSDLEMGNLDSNSARFGPYSFVWADGEDYYDGDSLMSQDDTAVPSGKRNKVNKKGAMMSADDEQR